MPDPNDTLTLTVRLHDPKEKQDAGKSTAWAVVQVRREDLQMSASDFSIRYLFPAAQQILGALKH